MYCNTTFKKGLSRHPKAEPDKVPCQTRYTKSEFLLWPAVSLMDPNMTKIANLTRTRDSQIWQKRDFYQQWGNDRTVHTTEESYALLFVREAELALSVVW